jgi:hypothetical protein
MSLLDHPTAQPLLAPATRKVNRAPAGEGWEEGFQLFVGQPSRRGNRRWPCLNRMIGLVAPELEYRVWYLFSGRRRR